MTYPIHGKGEISPNEAARLEEALKLAGIESLPENYGGWNTVEPWEEKLSGGEQQRLCLSRIFYHRPKFVILDECTDAVNVESEEKLYVSLQSVGVTCITISKRLALPELHDVELQLGVDAKGWSTNNLASDDQQNSALTSPQKNKLAAQCEAAQLKAKEEAAAWQASRLKKTQEAVEAAKCEAEAHAQAAAKTAADAAAKAKAEAAAAKIKEAAAAASAAVKAAAAVESEAEEAAATSAVEEAVKARATEVFDAADTRKVGQLSHTDLKKVCPNTALLGASGCTTNALVGSIWPHHETNLSC